MRQALKAIGWYLLLGVIWQLLELIFYKEIQPRIVDDIMGVLFFQFIYRAMGDNGRCLMCGNCKYHKYIDGEWTCDNPESENYSLETEFADDCVDCMKRESDE